MLKGGRGAKCLGRDSLSRVALPPPASLRISVRRLGPPPVHDPPEPGRLRLRRQPLRGAGPGGAPPPQLRGTGAGVPPGVRLTDVLPALLRAGVQPCLQPSVHWICQFVLLSSCPKDLKVLKKEISCIPLSHTQLLLRNCEYI